MILIEDTMAGLLLAAKRSIFESIVANRVRKTQAMSALVRFFRVLRRKRCSSKDLINCSGTTRIRKRMSAKAVLT
jgi:hypothetical protein